MLSEVGQYIEAGLPNMSGGFKYLYTYGDSWTGPFYNTSGGEAVVGVSQSSTSFANLYQFIMGFDPSKVSSLYGASDTVQTKSLRGCFLIRY